MATVLVLWTTTVAVLVLQCQSRPLVPALFVFGDSLVDVGNNNFLATPAKANFLPFGINFRNQSTGRFCDGMLIPDFIASYLGIPFPPAYFSLNLQSQDPAAVARGVNFGSASSGIFGWTGTGAVLPLRAQVNLFRAVQFRLVRSYGLARSSRLISKSIFYICTGNNDVNGILHIRKSLPALARNALLLEFASQLRTLYDWGARKFVIVGVSAVGCVPMNQIYGRCSVSGMASSCYYNSGLSAVLSYLRSMLPGAHIVTADLMKLMLEVKAAPEAHGFTNSYQGCCPMTEPWRWCYNYADTCPASNEFMFWDLVHPTEAFNKIAAQKWWSGTVEHIAPINISRLANL